MRQAAADEKRKAETLREQAAAVPQLAVIQQSSGRQPRTGKCKSACSCQPVVPLANTVEVAAVITSGYTRLEKSRLLTSSKTHRSVRHDGHCSNSHCP